MFVTSMPETRVQRKTLGAWYTPRSMVKLLVQWAVRFPDDHVLDPAVGDGVFLEEAARLLKARANTGRGLILVEGINSTVSISTPTQFVPRAPWSLECLAGRTLLTFGLPTSFPANPLIAGLPVRLMLTPW